MSIKLLGEIKLLEITIKRLDIDKEETVTTPGIIASFIHEKGIDNGISILTLGELSDVDLTVFMMNFYANFTEQMKNAAKNIPHLFDIFNRTLLLLDQLKDTSLQPSKFEKVN